MLTCIEIDRNRGAISGFSCCLCRQLHKMNECINNIGLSNLIESLGSNEKVQKWIVRIPPMSTLVRIKHLMFLDMNSCAKNLERT